jgi:hypothetical protein
MNVGRSAPFLPFATAMTAILWTGPAALDILRQLQVYHLTTETDVAQRGIARLF